MKAKKYCLYCNDEMIGRRDKRFCTPNCKSAYHYQKSLEEEANLYNKIDNQLKFNRRLLKNYNKAGKATVRKDVLLKEGFNPKYFTHYWKNKEGKVYLFCYEFGFLELNEYGKTKYVLVQWQPYMEK